MGTLIAFATRWGSQFGGINSFNQDLLKAFAIAFTNKITTICVVLNATQEESEEALKSQITLISLGAANLEKFTSEHEAEIWQKLLASNSLHNMDNTIWLGHDRITGEIALAGARTKGGKSALIHHMSYRDYESFSESSHIADDKYQEQKKLFSQADKVAAVGPLLRDALINMLDRENVCMLIPGLPEISPKLHFKNFTGFVSGRLNQDAQKIKQGHLGVAAFANAIKKADSTIGLPEKLKGENEPSLVLRGIDFEKSEYANTPNPEQVIKEFAEAHAERVVNLIALPFTTDRNRLFEDLRNSQVAMMPSWHEGFGLVAWEAIAAGVPVIVSKKSGVFQHLQEFRDGTYENHVLSIDVRGSNTEPYFNQTDLENLTNQLMTVAGTYDRMKQKASSLRETLSSEFSWAKCARDLAYELGFEVKHETSTAIPKNEQSPPLLTTCIDEKATRSLEIPRPLWKPEMGFSSSRLLRAEEAVIPFDSNREEFLTQQLNWAEATEHPITTRLLTGVGGTGKTRLALELCLRLQEHGWHTGFLHNDAKSTELIEEIQALNQNTLIVIDYAETRQNQFLQILEKLLKEQKPLQIRILLIARDSGEWWSLLPTKNSTCETLLDGIATSGPFLLPKLHDDLARRKAAYITAINAFASKLKIPSVFIEPNLENHHFSHPLHIQMLALLALHGEQPQSSEAISRSLVGHERRYWQMILEATPDTNNENIEDAALLMTLSTLTNEILTHRDGEILWRKINKNKALSKTLFKSLVQLYPGKQGLQGLQPDLLGEALVTQTLLNPIGENFLGSLLEQANETQRYSILTTLARILRIREELAPIIEKAIDAHFIKCAKTAIQVIIDTPSPLIKVIENIFLKLPNNKKSQACGLLNQYTHDDIVSLIDLSVLVQQHLTEKSKPKSNNSSAKEYFIYLSHLINFCISLGRQGSNLDAFEAIKEAEIICRQFIPTRPDLFESKLAATLTNYGIILSEQGRHEEALATVKESSDIYRRLAEKNPRKFEPDLTKAINNYSVYLDELGHHDDALKAAEESLSIRKRLALIDTEKYEPSLASALNNYSSYLNNHARYKEAMETVEESLKILSRLRTDKPEQFTSQLAGALGNYSIYSIEQGLYDQALQNCQESLDITKKLAATKPERFEPNLAEALSNYANILSTHGNYEEALKNMKESTTLYNKLTQTRAKKFEAIYHYKKLQEYLFFSLASDTNWQPIEKPVVSTHSRDRHEVDFYWSWLSTLATDNISQINTMIVTCDKYWNILDIGQKNNHIKEMLLLTGLAEKNHTVTSLGQEWRMRLRQLQHQHQGKLPAWMLEIARRKGIKL